MGMDTVPMGVATGVAGSLIATPVVNSIPANNGVLVLPAGVYVMYAVGANVSYQVQDAGGAWNNVSAVAVGGLIYSDGTNFRFLNTAGAPQNVTTAKIG
jgi:hypothetical protein